jgi:hypothetical protein
MPSGYNLIFYFKYLELYLELDFDASVFDITTIMHPSTYLNKVLLGSKQGTMQLWNIKTRWFYLYTTITCSKSFCKTFSEVCGTLGDEHGLIKMLIVCSILYMTCIRKHISKRLGQVYSARNVDVFLSIFK